MKILAIAFLVFVTTFYGCKKDSDTVIKGYYDSMHFVRQGGGQIDFNLNLTDNDNKLRIIVTKYSFRDTTIQIMMERNSDNATAFSSLYKAMNNQIQINGDFKQSTLPTGTWAYIYFVANKKETGVTNTELLNTLLQFEQLVRDNIQ